MDEITAPDALTRQEFDGVIEALSEAGRMIDLVEQTTFDQVVEEDHLEALRSVAAHAQAAIQSGYIVAGTVNRMLMVLLHKFAANRTYLYLPSPQADFRSWAQEALVHVVPGSTESARRDNINRITHTIEAMLLPIGEVYGAEAVAQVVSNNSMETLKEQAGRFGRLATDEARQEASMLLIQEGDKTGAYVDRALREIEAKDRVSTHAAPLPNAKNLYVKQVTPGVYKLYSDEDLTLGEVLAIGKMSGVRFNVRMA